MRFRSPAIAFAVALLSGACTETGPEGDSIGERNTEAFSGIGENETVRFTGNEPFWGGEASASSLTYRTPENIDGASFAIQRFAGNNGLLLSGKMNGDQFDLTVTPGACSDTMSDRTYPYVATLKIGDEVRTGCAWTDAQPFTGDPQP